MTDRQSPPDRQSLLLEADQLMEDALSLLDSAQAHLPAAKLDEALTTLRLRAKTLGS